ncbi:vesicle transport through interaction with t-SNAREs homolog 1A isoform X2 [Falco rusticolus]|uniref:vesicle transport through interaction with t-SNAREs homolog 1A isoform X2 n=1 Tax=Falco rusticolus TaxID=120794 RepID=UPI0018869A0C|nr:vesicle transport through interaction with t-SNAREs homolog 1A isoform X2 [Falco rusticolus]
MSSDFESYEQDFAVLTAEITGRIGKVPKLVGDEKKQMVVNVEKQLEEARELLEQMELEVREIPPQSRGMYSSRMRSYKQEMGKLEADFKRSRIAYSDEVRNELLGDDGNSSENQRAHLLDNTERLERSSRRLEAGYQIAVETGGDFLVPFPGLRFPQHQIEFQNFFIFSVECSVVKTLSSLKYVFSDRCILDEEKFKMFHSSSKIKLTCKYKTLTRERRANLVVEDHCYLQVNYFQYVLLNCPDTF